MSESGWNYLAVDLSASAAPLVSGVAGKKIRVLQAVLVTNDGIQIWRFASSTGPSGITGNIYTTEGVPIVLPHSPTGWFETAAGDDLDLTTTSSPAGIAGAIVYELV